MLVGSGGREHALAWALRRSPTVSELVWAPGNAGAEGLCETAGVKADDLAGLVKAAKSMKADLVVVGPEAPLAGGVAQALEEAGIPCFGPSQEAARLEWSKVFTKEFCVRHAIPTAPYLVFSEPGEAESYLRGGGQGFPTVLKADGLAAGKGVLICKDLEEALEGTARILRRREFGGAGDRMIVERFVSGEEASLMVFTDGERVAPMPPARDHKRIYDGDRGANTGGMGAYCPAGNVSAVQIEEAIEAIVRPSLKGMAEEGHPYRGVLYAGLMLTADGPSLLEFNCRFGDPETQVVVPLLQGDLAEICLACAGGRLDPSAVRWKSGAAVTVVLASGGYPGPYPTGMPITGVEEAAAREGVIVFHAGTRREAGVLRTAGGRVLDVTAVGESLAQARERAYAAASRIHFEGMHYRRDISAGAPSEESVIQ
ncbi:MAG: phosphoribosylamine--glycine ligase [Acidobacteriota bacterium]